MLARTKSEFTEDVAHVLVVRTAAIQCIAQLRHEETHLSLVLLMLFETLFRGQLECSVADTLGLKIGALDDDAAVVVAEPFQIEAHSPCERGLLAVYQSLGQLVVGNVKVLDHLIRSNVSFAIRFTICRCQANSIGTGISKNRSRYNSLVRKSSFTKGFFQITQRRMVANEFLRGCVSTHGASFGTECIA